MTFTFLSTILSLAVIEILLSVDNALVNATIANSLPEKQKKLALRVGIILGALFRVGALFVAAYIIKNDFIKILGGLYLIYLAVEHLGKEIDEKGHVVKSHTSLRRVIIEIAIADLVFSLDNVISAVSFSSDIRMVIFGVLVGTISMIFVTPLLSSFISRYKGFTEAAYVIVAFIGLALIGETLLGIHITEVQKFGIISLILGFTFFYEKNPHLHKFFSPVFKKSRYVIGIPLDITTAGISIVKKVFEKIKRQ